MVQTCLYSFANPVQVVRISDAGNFAAACHTGRIELYPEISIIIRYWNIQLKDYTIEWTPHS
jgi:hypothetical protein